MMMRAAGSVALISLLAALAACAPMSQDIRRQAEASAPFSEIQKNPDKFRGASSSGAVSLSKRRT